MKKYLKRLTLLYLLGFIIGNICNIMLWKEIGYQTSLLPIYFSVPASIEESGKMLFRRLFVKRLSFFGVGAIAGLTMFGFPFVVLSVLWYGFLAGTIVQIFWFCYGIKGIGLCLISLFPQMLFYIPGWMFFFFLILQMSQKSMGKRIKTRSDYGAYSFFLTVVLVCLLLGIWMESYVNHNLLGSVLKKWILFTKN